jgi:branched-chain amino acid transport system substrate-binding protein
MSGPYSSGTGKGSVVAARLAVDHFLQASPGLHVEIAEGDFRSDEATGIAMAREWIENQDLAAIVDVPMSAVALKVAELVAAHDRVALFSGAGTSDLTGVACSPNHVQWTYDTWALASGTGRALVEDGGSTWYFITADYAFGHQLEADTSACVVAAGGTVLGRSLMPFPETSDFSEAIVQAVASQAKVVGLANAGADTVNCIRQAAEFGVTAGGQRLAGLLFQLTDVHAVGLEQARGLVVTEAFYWDRSEASRAFSDRFAPLVGGNKPSMVHAGVYSATLHYLQAVAAIGPDRARSGRAVIDRMKATPTSDPLFEHAVLRADGRYVHDMYLFQVKKPMETRYPWDYYALRHTIPAAQAFRPIGEGNCPLVRT